MVKKVLILSAMCAVTSANVIFRPYEYYTAINYNGTEKEKLDALDYLSSVSKIRNYCQKEMIKDKNCILLSAYILSIKKAIKANKEPNDTKKKISEIDKELQKKNINILDKIELQARKSILLDLKNVPADFPNNGSSENITEFNTACCMLVQGNTSSEEEVKHEVLCIKKALEAVHQN